MKKLLIFVFSVLLFFGGCEDKKITEIKENKIIKLGVVLPLTGKYSDYGQETKRGIELALSEINKNGKKLKIFFEDSKTSPKDGITATNKLIRQDKVEAIIGDIASEITLAIAPLCKKTKTIQFSPGSSSPKLTYAGKYFFRNWISDAYEGKVLATFVNKKFKNIKNISILYVNNDYGLGLLKEFEQTINSFGHYKITKHSFSNKLTNYTTLIEKIKKDKPQIVYMIGYYQDYAKILKKSKELSLNTQFISSISFENQKIFKLIGNLANNVIYPSPINSENTVMEKYKASYKKKYHAPVGLFSPYAYDATKILFNILSKSKNNEEAISALLSITSYEGASGQISFDKNGDVIKPLEIKISKKGNFVKYE